MKTHFNNENVRNDLFKFEDFQMLVRNFYIYFGELSPCISYHRKSINKVYVLFSPFVLSYIVETNRIRKRGGCYIVYAIYDIAVHRINGSYLKCKTTTESTGLTPIDRYVSRNT